jgi:ornithine cyclodeaminase
VDSKDACSLEAGDLISAGVGEDKMIELGELVTLDDPTEGTTAPHAGGFKAVEERCSLVRKAGDVTIFKSVGIGIQDVAIASLVIKFAEETQVGVWVESYD